ncbi:MAG: PAS domain S-box protein [Myxococcales bacterium]|nr:PAS domain S-box protein [Myxococcales bacterium]
MEDADVPPSRGTRAPGPTDTTLRESERHHRLIAEMSSDLIGVASPDGVLCYLSPACKPLLGFEPAELIGRSGWDLVHPEDRAALADRTRHRENDAPAITTPLVFRALRRDGTHVWVEANAKEVPGADGGIAEIGFAIRDITGRREGELALRRSEERLRQLIEGVHEAIAVHRDEKLLFVNPAHALFLGYERPEQLISLPPLQFIHPEDRGSIEALWRDVKATERGAAPTHLPEIRYLRRDGEVALAEVAVQTVEFDGSPAILCSARDITERKRIQARLVQADRMVSVGTLAAGVAHEINNPLACVIANLDCVAEDLPKLADASRNFYSGADGQPGDAPPIGFSSRLADMEETLRDAREGAERVRLIVRDLRTLSRGDEDRRGPTDVRRVLESSINMAWNEIRHRARLFKDYGDVPLVDANEGRLSQVFVNLLINAAQSIAEGRADRNEIRIATRKDPQGRVLVEIGDTGTGIPAEIRARIFDPFFTTKPIGLGTGLGLSICHGIVSGFGGEITVESELGRGSLFRVALLAASQDAPVSHRTLPTPLPIGRRGRLMVVDDEPMIGTSVKRTLGGEHEVIAFTSAREALDHLVGGARFDLILCDLMMPVMTGMDLHAELGRVAPEQVDRMIFVTGGAFTPRAREFLDRVPNQRIEKPFDLNQLRAIIRDRLRR